MAVGEWDQRQLCPDGGCIGVIGPDGTCKVCGRAAPNWGDERNRGLIDPPDDEARTDDRAADGPDGPDGDGDEYEDDEYEDDDEDDDEDGDQDGDEDGDAAELGQAEDGAPRGEWAGRRLCPDGACIGVIGPDGRCKVCGRRDTEAAQVPASEPAEPADPAPVVAAASAEPAAGDRESCATPGCDGHIGADGRCAVCGKGAS
jgi:hypothetical protein